MRVVFLGPPGAGKGSLAALCKQHLGLNHLSTGEIFRKEITRKTSLGGRVQSFVTNGLLVPDELVVDVMAKQLSAETLKNGFVLDGFPRTRGQAVGLDRVLQARKAPLHGVVYLKVATELLVRRLSGRRVCSACGINYNIRTMPPKRPGQCDQCQAALITRKDDQPATIRKRLAVDRKEATKLLAYYKKKGLLQAINGADSLERVFTRALALFRAEGWIGMG